MALETLLGFRNIDSTENINARLSGLIPKGLVKGGVVVAEPASLEVRIVGVPDDNVVFLAYSPEGMMIREKSEERVLPVTAGITNVIVLRAKYLESQAPIASLEVLPLGTYNNDPEKANLIRFAAVTPPAGATAVLTEHIDGSFRDSIEGFKRSIIRSVVATKEDLPATSGFPAEAEVNFVANTFGANTTVAIDGTVFPIVSPISFELDSTASSPPGLVRVNASQKNIVNAAQNGLTGVVTVVTSTPHGLSATDKIRISSSNAPQANQKWTIETTPSTTSLTFTAALTAPWAGTGGVLTNTAEPSTVIARVAPGVIHNLVVGQLINIINADDPTFNGLFTITATPNSQSFEYSQTDEGYPTRNSGGGRVKKVDFSLPANGVETGTSAAATAANFAEVFNAASIANEIAVLAIGSSLQFRVKDPGAEGNARTLTKTDSANSIVISGPTFRGGVDPNPSIQGASDLQNGDLFVVLSGEQGTIEIWGYDGAIFRNLTSSLASTLLDFHRRNLFFNEKHLTENEKAALSGTIGTPSGTNRYVTEQDTSQLTTTIAAALQGADGVPPSGSNRFITEAHNRAQRSDFAVPAGQDFVALPLGKRFSLGSSNAGTDSAYARTLFNVLFSNTLLAPGGPSEYAQTDFTPVVVSAIYVDAAMSIELDPSQFVGTDGIFPRADAAIAGLPQQLWVKFSAVPNNGEATLAAPEVVREKERKINADTLAGPQRILPAQFQDLLNRTSELRFNAGIAISGTTITFPTNIFAGANLQGFQLRRPVGGRATKLTAPFTIDFATGGGTGGIVENFTPAEFSGPTLNQWTRYLLWLTPQQTIRVSPITPLLENSTELAFASALTNVSRGAFVATDGSYAFASVGVQSTGTAGTTILPIATTSLELYPYGGTNAREAQATIVIGDGTSSFGHFSGTDALTRALAVCKAGDIIEMGRGTYTGGQKIKTNAIRIDAHPQVVIQNPANTALTILSSNVQIHGVTFANSNVGVDVQPGAAGTQITDCVFLASVLRKTRSPSTFTFSPGDVTLATDRITKTAHGLEETAKVRISSSGTLPTGLTINTDYYVLSPTPNDFQLEQTLGSGVPIDLSAQGVGVHSLNPGGSSNGLTHNQQSKTVATYTVSDGSGTFWVGDFNGVDAIQRAHDVAEPGDSILIYPGTYSRVVWTKNRIAVRGFSASEVRIDAEGGVNSALIVTGVSNTFENLTLQHAAIGVNVQLGGVGNVFSESVRFEDDVQTFICFPNTASQSHRNFHPLVSGRGPRTGPGGVQRNFEVTVGDGLVSWGDYCGLDAINVALTNEAAGTRILVQRGNYSAVNAVFSQIELIGCGPQSVIRGNALDDAQCFNLVGSGNLIRGFMFIADNNNQRDFKTIGVKVTGNDNKIELISYQQTGNNRVEPHKAYYVDSGVRNRFTPHTGAPVGEISWTVGDGRVSFGDFNGSNGIIAAIQALPTQPRGTTGVFSAPITGAITFTDTTGAFTNRDLARHINISAAVNTANVGTWIVVAINSLTSVQLRRFDGGTFIAETGLIWDIAAGSKIEVQPGNYEPFAIPASRNDIDIEAWGAGADTVILGQATDTPLIRIDGHRIRVAGFRFAGGNPASGVALEVNGAGCLFERNRFETAIRYQFGPTAIGNQVLDAPENHTRTAYTVAASVSRGDFRSTDHQALQAAVDAAAADPHLKTVFVGAGVYTFGASVTVPPNVKILGVGYATQLVGNSTFPAFTLAAGGHQTIQSMRFTNFSSSVFGPAASVFFNDNWLESAPVNVNVTGNTTGNL